MLVRLAALCAAIWASSISHAEKVPPQRSEVFRGQLRLEVVDRTPQFLTFYRAARGTEGDARFALWEEHYDFAAVPPGPRGQEIARRLLDGAWTRYGAALPDIQAGAARLGDLPLDVLEKVAAVLEVRDPLKVRLTTYVGAFDNNAFTSRAGDGTPNVYFAIETEPHRRDVILPHEMTHAVHLDLARMSGGWERTIAATVIMEGLSVHTTMKVAPGFKEAEYIEYSSGWWDSARSKKQEIMAGILPVLADSKPETVFRFTMGTGVAGLEREAYAAGFWVVEQLLREGMSLAQIARVSESEIPALARGAAERMLSAEVRTYGR